MENATQQEAFATNRRDIHQQVTDTIIKSLEAGTIPWHQPWTNNGASLALPKNFSTGNHYQGINIVLLWSSAIEHSYASSEWASFRQWQGKNEFIRKGEKGTTIVYADTFEKEVDGEIKNIPFLKSSVVFNRCQLSGYKPKTKPAEKALFEIIDPVEVFVANTRAMITHKTNGPCYIPLYDEVHMPFKAQFVNTETSTATEGYYSTLMHELVHWTGAEHRLNREFGKKFGDQQYACEELVAELGAAFLCAGFEIGINKKEDHAAYIANWLKVLKDNKQFIVTAASSASKAVEYLHQLQP